MKLSCVSPGLRVRVRNWDDLEREFGTDEWGDIECTFSFTDEMKKFSGNIYTVRKIAGEQILFEEEDEFCKYYTVSADMLEPEIINDHLDDDCPCFSDDDICGMFDSLESLFSKG